MHTLSWKFVATFYSYPIILLSLFLANDYSLENMKRRGTWESTITKGNTNFYLFLSHLHTHGVECAVVLSSMKLYMLQSTNEKEGQLYREKHAF